MTHQLLFKMVVLTFCVEMIGCSIGGRAEAAPLATTASITDYLLMNVCLDQSGRVVDGNPLECKVQRDIEVGDRLFYVHGDFQAAPRAVGCPGFGQSHRFAFPLPTKAGDGTGASFPLIVGWTDYPPHDNLCAFGRFDARDTVTLLTVDGAYASLVGAFHHKHWYLTIGDGYRDASQKGVGRFLGTWSFPSIVPPLGESGWAIFKRKTLPFSDGNFDPSVFMPTDPNLHLATTIQFWKHTTFTFGSRDHPSKSMETLLHMPFTQTGDTGDAPGDSRGSEHLYLTRELGYVTRWESWARDDNAKDVLGLARTAYQKRACTLPTTIEGQITPHMSVGPVLDDANAAVYKQMISTVNMSGATESHWWFMIGCHDFTNVHAVAPYDLSKLVNEDTFGRDFIRQFVAP